MPMNMWDGWALWTRKALLLTDFQHLAAAFFTDRAYADTHQNYPLLLPLVESIWFRFAGQIDTRAVHIELWLLLVGFVWAAAFLLVRRGAPILVWAPLLLVVALASGTFSQLLSGSGDVPMALFAGLGLLLLGFWISDQRPDQLVLGTLFLAAAANIKNEGVPVAVIALILAGAAARGSRARQHLVLAAAGLLIAIAPWHIWSAVHGVPSDADVPISKVLDISYKLGITNKNVVIDSNYIQSQTVTNLALAVALQGISIFDGFWQNVSITNNVVLTSGLAGITIAGVNGLHIINNSVMNIPLNGVSQSAAYWMYSGATWITAGGTTHEGGTTSNVIVRNNIAPLIAATAAASENCPITESFCSHTANPYVELDHNLSLDQTAYTAPTIFLTFSPTTAQYNLVLKGTASTNPAIGTGNSVLMPATDILGHVRSAASPDLGAYLP